MLRRFHLILVAVLVALALAAVPAFAGEEEDDDDGSGDTGDVGAAPEGGVDTGGGGMADNGPAALLLGLGAGTLILVATAGGLVVRRRNQE